MLWGWTKLEQNKTHVKSKLGFHGSGSRNETLRNYLAAKDATSIIGKIEASRTKQVGIKLFDVQCRRDVEGLRLLTVYELG